jgi:hypothetical protein
VTDLPCRADPEKWFAREYTRRGEAIHACVSHCPWREECAAEPAPEEGVLAGVFYTRLRVPHSYQPEQVPCLLCVTPEQLHGTEAGFSRHRRAGEKACAACRAAKNAADYERRRPRPERVVPPPVDEIEARQRALVAAMKKSA